MFCKIEGPSGDINKLSSVPKTFQELHDVILRKFGHEVSEKFSLKYKDLDGELVTVNNDEDLKTAILTNEDANVKTLRFFISPRPVPHSNQSDRTGSTSSQYYQSSKESLQRSVNEHDKEFFNMEGLVGQLDYISSDPGKVHEENENLTLLQQLSPMLVMRRSMSHNPQLEPHKQQGNYDNRRFYMMPEQNMDKPMLRVTSPPPNSEEILANKHFNEGQLRTIMSLVERKVGEIVEEKIGQFSDQIMGMFEREVWSSNMGRGINNYGFQARSQAFRRGIAQARPRGNGQEELRVCVTCDVEIFGVKYSCLMCRNFVCCEKCEGIINHEHPLLKIRPSQRFEGFNNLSNGYTQSQQMSFMTPQPMQPTFLPGINAIKRADSITINNPQGKPLETVNKNIAAAGAKRGIENGNIENLNGFEGDLSSSAVYLSRSAINYGNDVRRSQGSVYSFETTNESLFKKSTNQMSMTPNPQGSGRSMGERQVKQYKVAVSKPPVYEVTTVKLGSFYKIEFTIKNNGEHKWPDNCKLVCIEGNHKGSELPLQALDPGSTYDVVLHLEAPWELGRFFNEWKVQYTVEGTMKSFGKEISIEIEVVDVDHSDKEKAKKEKVDSKHSKGGDDHGTKKNTTGGDKAETETERLMKEFECSEEIIRYAKVLQDFDCAGSLKEKIEFIKKCKNNNDLNQIVSAYLSNPGRIKDMTGR